MSDFTEREEHAILAAFDMMDSATDATEPSVDQTETTLERLYVETLGLLPYELDPIEPAPEQKARLMAAISATSDTADSQTQKQARELAAPQPPAAPVTGTSLEDSPAGDVVPFASAKPSSAPSSNSSSNRPRRNTAAPVGAFAAGKQMNMLAVAASIIALVMSAAAGWLFTQLQSTEKTVEQLDQQVAELNERERQMQLDQTNLSTQVQAMARAMNVMSMPGVEICPLRPMSESDRAARAFAVLYMAPGSKNWYLRATNLPTMPDGQVYRVWFNTPEGPISAGRLDAGAEAELQFPPERLGDLQMLSVTVTVEDNMESEQPEGPMVLFGDEKMQIL